MLLLLAVGFEAQKKKMCVCTHMHTHVNIHTHKVSVKANSLNEIQQSHPCIISKLLIDTDAHDRPS